LAALEVCLSTATDYPSPLEGEGGLSLKAKGRMRGALNSRQSPSRAMASSPSLLPPGEKAAPSAAPMFPQPRPRTPPSPRVGEGAPKGRMRGALSLPHLPAFEFSPKRLSTPYRYSHHPRGLSSRINPTSSRNSSGTRCTRLKRHAPTRRITPPTAPIHPPFAASTRPAVQSVIFTLPLDLEHNSNILTPHVSSDRPLAPPDEIHQLNKL
jgi:hypothetical protein